MLETQVTEKLCSPPTSYDQVNDNEYQPNITEKVLNYLSDDIANEIDDQVLHNQRKSKLNWSQWIIYGSIILSWFFGSFGFSVAWIILLAITLHFVYNRILKTALEDCIRYEKRQLSKSKAFSCDETVEWLNFLLNRWWLNSSSSVFTWLKSNVDPILKETKPAILDSITLKSLSFGSNTPFVTSIRAFDINGRRSTMASMADPVVNGSTSLRYRLMFEAEVGVVCPEFKMTLTGKTRGMEMDLAIQKLIVSGKVQVIGHFGLDAPFPHIYKVSMKFIEKPKVDFNVEALGTAAMMEYIGITTWARSLVVETLATSIVDPYELNIYLSQTEGLLPAFGKASSLAIGIIRLSLSWIQSSGKQQSTTKNDEDRWCVIKVGSQVHTTCRSSPVSHWSDSNFFLVDSLKDRVQIKVKARKILLRSTIAEFEDTIENYLKDRSTFEGVLQKKGVGVTLKLEYNKLDSLEAFPSPNLHEDFIDGDDSNEPIKQVTGGILYLTINKAENIANPDPKRPLNPYCAVFHNMKKVKTTQFVSQTANPIWDTTIAFIINDFSQANVKIAVCNWDSAKMTDAGFLGFANVKRLNSSEERRTETLLLEPTLDGFDALDQTMERRYKQSGTINITIAFRPVALLSQQGIQDKNTVSKTFITEENVEIPKTTFGHPANFNKPVLNGLNNHIDGTGLGLVEVAILRARNLIAKDLNGFSDPFCEIRINDEYYCKTTVKKRTLNPIWDEKLTIRLPKSGDSFSVILWDDDTFGKDFLGSISFNVEEIKRLASEETSEWFVLKETKSGEIELKFRIISDFLENSDYAQIPKNSPYIAKKNTVLDSFKSRPNFYGEDVTDAQPFSDKSCNGHNGHATTPPPLPDLPPKIRSQSLGTGTGSNSPVLSLARSGSSVSRANENDSPQLSVRSANQSTTSAPPITSPNNTPISAKYDFIKSKSSPSKPKTATLTPVPIPVPPERKSSLPFPSMMPLETVSPTSESSPNSPMNESEPSPLSRGSMAYSSFHEMKRKMKKTFSHPLRRFRSEANVHEDKTKAFKDRVKIEAHGDVYSSCSNIEKLADELNSSPTGDESSASSKPSNNGTKSLRYFNIQGSVVQATGIDLPKEAQMCCRVRLLPSVKQTRGTKFSPKTIAKSKSIAASPNQAINLDFQLNLPNGVPADFSLSFEIRKSNKETVASKSITLQELFEDAIEEGDEMRTCLSLNTGATLEVVLSHGKENGDQKSQKSRLLRSWSVHRIGKI